MRKKLKQSSDRMPKDDHDQCLQQPSDGTNLPVSSQLSTKPASRYAIS